MPVGATGAVLSELKPLLRPETLITDAGSTKVDVVAAARSALGDCIGQFIPGHPIAGAEKVGPEAADASLYQGRAEVLTHLEETDGAAKSYRTRHWDSCGGRGSMTEPASTDDWLSSFNNYTHIMT